MDKRYKKPKDKLPKSAAYAVLVASGLPKMIAKKAAGYSEKSNDMPKIEPYAIEVKEIRQRLSDLPGFVSYVDLISWFNAVKDNSEVDITNRKDAAKAIVKMQGYDAPLKMEVESKVKVTGAVMQLKQLLTNTGLNAQVIIQEQERRKKVREIEFREVIPAQIATKQPETAHKSI